MTVSTILTVNGGSSSLKCGLFAVADRPALIRDFNRSDDESADSLKAVLDTVRNDGSIGDLQAIGHRIVHGGDLFDRPVVITDAVLRELYELAPLAPLHQPANLRLIEVCAEFAPDVPQVACFDTAFHRNMPAAARKYALPKDLTESGIRAYGFHGLSYEFICERLSQDDEYTGARRVIAMHLGAGASMCAIMDGQSVATTMGFSTADGLPMMTRSGSVDPGVLIHLLRRDQLDADALERLIYNDSGLLGMSGEAGGMRELRASDNPRAQEAIDYFVYKIAAEIGRLTAILGGVDLLVFTGGIGANDESIRNSVTDQLTWLKNRPRVCAIPSNEEVVIARQAARLLNAAQPDSGTGE